MAPKGSKFQTVASETAHCVSGSITDTLSAQLVIIHRSLLTFFENETDNFSMQELQCRLCGGRHDVLKCHEFI